MIGGPDAAVRHLDPIFATLAPGDQPAVEGAGTAPLGYLHCGPSGAGHFVKMVHNGIEYGVMAAYAEGMNILQAANSGKGSVTRMPRQVRYRTPNTTSSTSTCPLSPRFGGTAASLARGCST